MSIFSHIFPSYLIPRKGKKIETAAETSYVAPTEFGEQKYVPDPAPADVPEKNAEGNNAPLDPFWEYRVFVERDRSRCSNNTEFLFRIQQKEKPGNNERPGTVDELLDWFTEAQKGSQSTVYSDTITIELANGLEVLHRKSVIHITCTGWNKIQS